MGVKIITDSACDLPKEIIDAYGIEVLPLLVNCGDEERLDGITIDAKTVLDGMRDGKIYKTAQIPPVEMADALKKYSDVECIYLSFSSRLSGTYTTARIVLDNMKEDSPELGSRFKIVDTKCASGGMGLVVLKAAQMAKEGCGLEEIEEAARYYSDHMQHIFTVDCLDYICRGGRVTKAEAFIGGLLNIKPILNVEDGALVPIEKARGRKHLHRRMVGLIEERGLCLDRQCVMINHGDDLEAAERVKSMIEDRFGTERFIVNSIGCAIGAHSGPGTLALFFLDEEPPMGQIDYVEQGERI